MVRRLISSAMAVALMVAGYAPSAMAATDTSLLLSQGSAFAILGHSCGGIQEQAFASGFDTSGDPTGAVYMQTRCGGSGRGGGYHTTTYSAWATVTWDFGGVELSYAKLVSAPTVDPAFTQSDGYGDSVYNSANHAFLSVAVPDAPTGVTAAYSSGQYLVSWSADSLAPSIQGFTVTASPIAPSTAAVLTVSAAGSATSALIGPLEPLTGYQIVVSSINVAGTSPDSAPAVQITTPASTHPPAAPTAVKVSWIGSSALLASWAAAAPGDSPVDVYRVKVTAHDADPPVPGPYARSLGGTTLSTSFTLNSTLDWKIKIRAHNAAGWGPWSKAVILHGL